MARANLCGRISRFMIVGAFPRSVLSFRGDLIRKIGQGCDVGIAIGHADESWVTGIKNLGAEFFPYSVQRNGLSPSKDLRTLRELRKLFRQWSPDVVLAYTIKPIVWGGIAARSAPEMRFFALVTGLGYAFEGRSWKRRLLTTLVKSLYRFSLRRAEGVIFQNSDNRDLFVKLGIVPAGKCYVVNGSGVHVDRFSVKPLPSGPCRFLLIARLLGEKGIREYVAAARIVKRQYPEAIFQLLGPADPSPDGISLQEVGGWVGEGVIDYLGETDDVRPFIADCHVYCLPSYHEGMPRTVLEAMAMARPVLTTQTCGCRETVVEGMNGWTVPVRDADSLAERMIWFLAHQDRWKEMGRASRDLAVEKFDVHQVNRRMMEIMGIESNDGATAGRTPGD